MARRWHADPTAHPCRCKRPGGGPGLSCWFVVEPPAGIEPATPSLPSMRGWFTPPHTTFRGHTTAQVKGAAGDRGVGWREVACSAVSGKSLARAPTQQSWHGRRRHRPEPCPQADWHLRCSAVLRRSGSRVQRRVMRQGGSGSAGARSGDMTADVACGAAWSLQVQVEGATL
jgi:hypothetical protein